MGVTKVLVQPEEIPVEVDTSPRPEDGPQPDQDGTPEDED